MENDILYIDHQEFEEERFPIITAEYNLYEAESGIWEFGVFIETGEAIKRDDELKSLVNVSPNLEAVVVFKGAKPELKVGDILTQKEGYDYERDEHLSNFYYFRHSSVEPLKIEIIEISEDHILAELQGKTVVNSYTEPDTDVSLRTKFKLNPEFQKGFQ